MSASEIANERALISCLQDQNSEHRAEAIAFIRYRFSVPPHNRIDNAEASDSLDELLAVLHGVELADPISRRCFDDWKDRHMEYLP